MYNNASGVNAFRDICFTTPAGGLPEGLFDAAAADFYYTLALYFMITYYYVLLCRHSVPPVQV